MFVAVHKPMPERDSPGGQTLHGPFRHGAGGLNAAVCTGFVFLKGWKNERELFFSDTEADLTDGDECEVEARAAGAPAVPTREAELPE